MDKFNSKHLGFLILGTTIVSLKTYPPVFTKNGGRDSWIALIISSICILGYIIYILKVCKETDCYNLYDIYTKSLGKILGSFLLLLFAGTLFLTITESASVEANSMHTNMLLDTPPWFFLLFFIIPGLYTVKKGKAAIISVSLIVIILVIISGINLAILTVKYKHFEYLFPILKDGITLNFIKSILQTLGLYGSISIILPYLDEIKEKKQIIKHQILALLFVIQIELVSISGVIMTFEIDLLNEMSYPKLLQTQLVDLARFMESGEFFVMLQIVGGWYIKYIICFYSLIKVLRDMNIKNKFLIYIVSSLCFLASYLISNNLFILFQFLDYYTYICLINYVALPFIVFTIFLLRSKKRTTV